VDTAVPRGLAIKPVSSGATSKFDFSRISLVLAFPLGFQASDMTA
jgi:hypothetical protein